MARVYLKASFLPGRFQVCIHNNPIKYLAVFSSPSASYFGKPNKVKSIFFTLNDTSYKADLPAVPAVLLGPRQLRRRLRRAGVGRGPLGRVARATSVHSSAAVHQLAGGRVTALAATFGILRERST